ncbi:MAG: SDR family NAD(P)-dependent oxidoreductase, partial [Candidatus Scalindua sp.]|nr:SDR family NAD(P)-dependent oxidoreductase [Candidatus Scalindua sp.]
GTYLITGGCGGLGLLFAKYFAKTRSVNLILTGRSAPDPEKRKSIQALEKSGSSVFYLQADVCDVKGMKEGLHAAIKRFGPVHGVIHAAGIQGSQNLFEKKFQDFQKVLDPKIKGTLVLDEVLAEEPLDFIVYFSSSSAILGDFGSCDYSMANRFLMAYTNYRNELRSQGKGSGKAIVINWPLWKDGGMGSQEEEKTDFYLKSSGQGILETEEGLALFEQILSQDKTQHLVVKGQPDRVRRFLGLDTKFPPSLSVDSPVLRQRKRPEMRGLDLEQCVIWDLKELINSLLKIPRDKLDGESNLADLGFDSISLTEFAHLLTQHFSIEVTADLFFGHPTLNKLVRYFISEHKETMQGFYQDDVVGQVSKDCDGLEEVSLDGIPTVSIPQEFSPSKSDDQDIAIIGMSGRFPNARNIEEMWKILAEGACVVEEIPADRFDWREYYGDPGQDINKTNCKWSGTLPGAAEFDPLFFEISPREAEGIDPRQRLLLQESWNALEDAGYGPKQVKNHQIGMYVGVEEGDYQRLVKTARITSNHEAILASRLAYFLNLSGPTMAINTACSSSLVAAHQACLSLRSHECDTAIVAGVQLMFTPDGYIGMSQAGMSSANGKCFAFDKRANGIVPGEAVAVVVIKRLSEAIAEGDPIHAIIRGSGINYDGKTNGITAPSGVSQTRLLKNVYQKTKINPTDIEYIVAHGTGTSLGDPIEINALINAFNESVTSIEKKPDVHSKQGYCALTSNKTNFGHTAAASGLVSVINLVQAFRHKMIPASLHCEQQSESIHWKESPFYVNKTSRSWPQRPGKERLGAVSSFGMSGTNAHMVLQEFSMKKRDISETAPYYLLALSAKTEKALSEKIKIMISTLQQQEITEQGILPISYTLLEGRHHFQNRCAIVVQDLEDAVYVWKQVGEEKRPNLFQGEVPREFTGQKAMRQMVDSLLEQSRFLRGNPEKYQETLYALADFYCQGYEIPWQNLFDNPLPHRIHLPTYPFDRERYWVSETDSPTSSVTATVPTNLVETETHMANISGNRESFEKMCFEEVCQEQTFLEFSRKEESTDQINTLVCLLSDPKNQDVFLAEMKIQSPQTKVIFMSQMEGEGRDSETYEEVLQNIQEEESRVDAVLYLWPLEDPACIQDVSPIVTLLQAMAATKFHPGRILFAGQFENSLDQCYLESWIGFERSLKLVLPNTSVAAIYQEAGNRKNMIKEWVSILLSELRVSKIQSVLYQEGKRHIYQIRPTSLQSTSTSPIKQGGTYLITGGCGGLGFLFAEYLARTYSVNLILTGRSTLTEEKQTTIQRLEQLGSSVFYLQADVCDLSAMENGLKAAKEIFGEVHGVLHAAGISGSQSIFEKELQDFQKVLDPKIKGTLVLDEILREEPLDFICYFSSSSAILGDFGSCDYAIGNRFLMAYATHRNGLYKQEKCSGKAIVINWPLWKDGGMGSNEEEQIQFYLKSSGQRFLETHEGLVLFEQILSQSKVQGACHQYLVLMGVKSRVHQFLGLTQDAVTSDSFELAPVLKSAKPSNSSEGNIEQSVYRDLKKLMSHLLKVPQVQFDGESNLADFGFDSISLSEFARLLSEHYGLDITPSLFFGHSTLKKLTYYFVKEHAQKIRRFYREEGGSETIVEPGRDAEQRVHVVPEAEPSFVNPILSETSDQAIAIIGMSGRFPKANTVEELWDNIKNGRNCITEISEDRQDCFKYFADSTRSAEKSGTTWGGFIQGIDQFDPIFFAIPPGEANSMDPRQRLFLEEAWHTFEDAGYMGERIRGMSCGVYVGVEEGDYGVGSGQGSINSNQNATLAARIAYALDLKGPNLALTASCSSGLVALHQACLALRQGDCEMALAAGVNLLISPMGYVGLNQYGMLSPNGKCRVFDQRANGLVPGEAVAVVLLKPLSQAISDGDRIYGSIKASGVNYDGKTNGITAPNPVSQAELIKGIYDKYQIDPARIQYVLSHSVGSKLGDPIEFEALNDSFQHYTGKKQYCYLGSIKPLIGHTFAASGIVSLITLLMAMRDRTIPALYHYENPNEYINFSASPFLLNRENQPWNLIENQPRLGAIGSTGISGTNAHVVIEDYVADLPDCSQLKKIPHLVVFSAKTPDCLTSIVQNIIEFLQKRLKERTKISLSNLSYTLQVGREAMKERLAIIVGSPEELLTQLKEFLSCSGESNGNNLFIGRCSGVDDVCDTSKDTALVQTACEERNLEQLATLWVKGFLIPWDNIQENRAARIIGLPTYPFTKRHCWLDELPDKVYEGKNRKNINQTDGNKVAELYSFLAKGSSTEFREEYITFFPFSEKIPGFSMTRIALNPEQYPDEIALIKNKQRELRQVLFCKEDFNRARCFLDFGCGYGTDVIQIAALYSHIETHGFTITPAQAELGKKRIAHMNLSHQAKIFNKDSSKDKFPGEYDLVLGVEVSCHIPDKDGLFKNIISSLKDGGRVLLMDFIANLRGAINDPNVSVYIPTREGWADLLTRYHLLIDEIIDVSPEIANSLHDPDYKINTSDLPQVVRDSWQNWANNAVAMEKVWVSYSLFKLEIDQRLSQQELWDHNAKKLSKQTPYSEAIESMLNQGNIPYPKPVGDEQENSLCSNLNSDKNRRGKSEEVNIKTKLALIFAQVLGFQQEELESLDTLQELGISSLNAVEILESINTQFNLNLPTSLLFECNTLDALAKYLVPFLQDGLSKKPGIQKDKIVKVAPEYSGKKPSAPQREKENSDVAIIGISCRCSGANGKEELWNLVSQGKECIQQVSDSSWLEFFRQNGWDSTPPHYGAMSGLDKFDPLFFRISPKEAQSMDASQRILLEECYKALEDAGYDPSSLREQQVGTYIGASGGYPSGTKEFSHLSMLGADTSILASRLAYFLDLKGPALAINTACSSSLVAIDLACNALKNGEIDLAIAGGITVWEHPAAFISMNNAGMLSSTGQCRPFDSKADGIVVGDGVGIVIVKRLHEAQRDRDSIYGIIRGSGTNQDGQTSGITVPSFLRQSQLQTAIYRKTHIPVEDIQYIETHGTATKLGDPIEIHALTNSFQQFTSKKTFCAIGSLKANIGHTAAAAGVLSLIKVLLSLKYRQIPPSINYNRQNEHIDFANSPVYVNTELKEWQTNAKGSRLAAISSFGYSGTNAHMIIEEYNNQSPMKNDQLPMKKEPVLIVLSARNEVRLKEMVNNLHTYLSVNGKFEHSMINGQFSIRLEDLAYTLQVGREAMEERLAMVVESTRELQEKLQNFITLKHTGEDFYRGQTKENKKILDVINTDELEQVAEKWIQSKNFSPLLDLWVKGLDFDWNRLYSGLQTIGNGPVILPHRINLPAYPFARESFGLPEITDDFRNVNGAVIKQVHPLLHENTSDLLEQRYSSVFTGQEFFLADHVVKGQKILPGVACLEMARAAVEQSVASFSEGGQSVYRLKNVVWTRPIVIETEGRQASGVPVHIRLFMEENQQIDTEVDGSQQIHYEIYFNSDPVEQESSICSQGVAVVNGGISCSDQPDYLDLTELQTRLTNGRPGQNSLNPDQCYSSFKAMGIDYGEGYRCIQQLFVGSQQVLAKLSLPSSLLKTQSGNGVPYSGLAPYTLHPSIMDSALQAAIGLAIGSGTTLPSKPAIPFALEALEIIGPCTANMWAWVRKESNSSHNKENSVEKLDVDLCDDSGKICVKMRGYCSRILETDPIQLRGDSTHSSKDKESVLADSLPDSNTSQSEATQHFTTFTGKEFFLRDHEQMVPGVVYLEMARAAAATASASEIVGLRNVVWNQPLVVSENRQEVCTTLIGDRDHYAYKITTGGNRINQGQAITHSQGKIMFGQTQQQAPPANINIQAIQSRCTSTKGREECDQLLKSSHGASLMSIEYLQYNCREALANLQLPSLHNGASQNYILHPSILNGAVLSSVILSLLQDEGNGLSMPFALEELRIYGELPEQVYAYVKDSDEGKESRTKGTKHDIYLCNTKGEIVISLKGFTTIPLGLQSATDTKKRGVLYATPQWVHEDLSEEQDDGERKTSPIFILADANPLLQKALSRQWPGARIEILSVIGNDLSKSILTHFLNVFRLVRTCLEKQPEAIPPLVILIPEQQEDYLYAALSGLLKTVRLENAKIVGKVIGYNTDQPDWLDALPEMIQAELCSTDDSVDIRYTETGIREVKRMKEIEGEYQEEVSLPVAREGDVIWITGGLGGLGLIFVRSLGCVKGVKLVLSGRSPLDDTNRAVLEELQKEGIEPLYLRCDVSQKQQVEILVRTILEKYGKINGILHAAGVIRDAYLLKKTEKEIKRVFRPKVTGLLAIEEATCGLKLNFMLLFSSLAGTHGNPGQLDYAGANAFLDAFASYRNQRVKQGECFGKTLSMNWPLWKEGGMSVDQQFEVLMERGSGMAAMDTLTGINALNWAFHSPYEQVLVAYGDPVKIRSSLLNIANVHTEEGGTPSMESSQEKKKAGFAHDNQQQVLSEAVCQELVKLVSEIQKIEIEKIDLETELSQYGFDSIGFTEFTNSLNQLYRLELMPTVFFEYSNLLSLGNHLITNYSQSLLEKHNPALQPSVKAKNSARETSHQRFVRIQKKPACMPKSMQEPIAVIGMSGRFPGSKDLETFWNNLEANRDLITEVPKDRWDWRDYYGEPQPGNRKTKIKWGGFIADIDCFDPFFFGITPLEAESMDPQFRLLTETIWATIEDAGYPASALSGSKTGVFVGVSTMDYRDLWQQEKAEVCIPDSTGPYSFIIANRTSYIFNLHGPSEVIDTACSSSLVAIHRAIESMRQGSCELALVGGVNVIANPDLTISFSQTGILSEEGRCKTFDEQANGYVRGEGVAAVLLKPLGKAIEDRDRIYGLLRGSAENHGGKATSPTAPNPVAQQKLLVEAYQRAGVDPRTVSYIEAHGTGTKLGDPVEIEGLKGGFATLYKTKGVPVAEKPYCALGSVKTNIGHLEAAAGISGLIKTLLMLGHRKIPGNPHLTEPNPYLQLEGSPFYLVKETKNWEALLDENQLPVPRIAGVSSFGVGGANAHVIVEEYRAGQTDNDLVSPSKGNGLTQEGPYLIVLSAKNEQRLKEIVKNLHQFLLQYTSINLANIAYTLQVGREAMEQRLGILVDTRNELIEKLQDFLALRGPVGQNGIKGLYRGQVKTDKGKLADFSVDKERTITIDTWIKKRKLSKLLDVWVKGLNVEWNKLYESSELTTDAPIRVSRISLPTYPFARERYWAFSIPKLESNSNVTVGMLHPLLHQNTSDFSEQRFSSTFTGEEFFLADHVVQGQKILPGVAYLEMARAAVAQVMGSLSKDNCGVIQFKDIVWAQPFAVEIRKEDCIPVHIRLVAEKNNQIFYEIYSKSENSEQEIIHSQGFVLFNGEVSDQPRYVDLKELQSQINQGFVSAEQCYEAFRTVGVEHGPGHQGLERVYYGCPRNSSNESVQPQTLAKLTLPVSVSDTQSTRNGGSNQFVLHPSLMDAALQASIGIALASGDSLVLSSEDNGPEIKSTLKPSLPFALESLEIFAPCTASMWAWIRLADDSQLKSESGGFSIQKLDIDLCDVQGKVCVRMRGFSSRVLEKKIRKPIVSSAFVESDSRRDVLTLMGPVWNVISLPKTISLVPDANVQVVIIGGTQEQRDSIQKVYPNGEILEISHKDSIEVLTQKLKKLCLIDHLIWIAPGCPLQSLREEGLVQQQSQGVLQLFRMIKTLLCLDYGFKDFSWTVITIQTQAVRKKEQVNPTHASVHGLVGSMAKEYPNWKIRLLDMHAKNDWPIQEMFSLPFDAQGDALVYRGKEWFKQSLIPVRELVGDRSLYRKQGVYIVIGGAGGIGEAWSKYMIKKYQAQIIWIGRRPMDASIQAKLDLLSQSGPVPGYIQADAGNQRSLQKAYEEIKRQYPQIHGVVHSAIVLLDQSLNKMDEKTFRAGLAAKVDVSVRLAQVFHQEPLDFVLFFSSLQSFGKAAGQSNYAAGCVFKDAFALQLAKEWADKAGHPAVKVMNWGYWGSVGVVTDPSYRDRMEQAGAGSIEPEEGMNALNSLLQGPMDQVGLVKTIESSQV